jgi:hypothetical protein
MSETQTNATADTSAAEGRKRAEAANFLPDRPWPPAADLRARHALRRRPSTRWATRTSRPSSRRRSARCSTSRRAATSATSTPIQARPEDIAAAESWIVNAIGTENVKGLTATGDKSLLQKVVDEYKERGLASAEEAAASPPPAVLRARRARAPRPPLRTARRPPATTRCKPAARPPTPCWADPRGFGPLSRSDET